MNVIALALALATIAPMPRRAVVISLDGLRPDAIAALGPSGAPVLHRLMREGAHTLDARTDPRRTYTLPNHICMLTGVPADGDQGHGFTRNRERGPLLHALAGRYVPSMFDVVHDHGGRTLFFAAKPKFRALALAWSHRHGAPDRVGESDGTAKIDGLHLGDDDEMAEAAGAVLARDPPELLFLHLKGPDSAGHSDGWTVEAGSTYMRRVAATDALVGVALAPLLAEKPPRSVVVLTSDHGGFGRGHRKAELPENHTVPFIVWGPGIGASSLDALVAERPIRNCAAGNVALRLLGLPVIEGSVYGARTPAPK